MKLTLGPVLGYWTAAQLRGFYADAMTWPLDTVYLGETVCSKRRALRPAEWIELAGYIQSQGKNAVLSTLTLIEAQSELTTLKRLCGQDGFMVEANDYAAVRLLGERGVKWVGGASLNAYNTSTLEWLVRHGLVRWQPPVDLPLDGLARMRDDLGPRWPETEMLAWGRVPLAWSARCFSARAHNRPKDDCGFVCERYPDGLEARTREGEPFLTINGIQILSERPRDLTGSLPALERAGVSLLRVNPVRDGTGDAVQQLAKAAATIPAGS